MISYLQLLKSASSLSDVANILGFKPKALSYILYIKSSDHKYTEFEIPKRSGGNRKLSAPYPELKNLQKRLAEALESCIAEINQDRRVYSVLSHGFRPNYSIITNALTHRKKKHVFNLDLENFFGTINFGRVRGFFISNQNFQLHPSVATVIAQIACHENSLPQGSPCSPVISNLIGHILDIRLAKLAHKTGLTYSRYADDLTFSTNKKDFPNDVARIINADKHQWEVGNSLSKLIKKTGFSINESKTRMQYHNSRQDVTGLIVNKIVNTRSEYRRNARAMVNKLVTTGSYQIKTAIKDVSGNLTVTSSEGTLEKLNGILSFIDSVSVYEKNRLSTKEIQKKTTPPQYPLTAFEKTYRQFLAYKLFYASQIPVIVCEGKTDITYLKCALTRLAADYPLLAQSKTEGGIEIKLKFLQKSSTTGRLLHLNGGGSELVEFAKTYLAECRKLTIPGKENPVIVFVDNCNHPLKSVHS